MSPTPTHGLVDQIMALRIFEPEWVLWVLIGLSVISVFVIIERVLFLFRHRVDVVGVRAELIPLLDDGDLAAAATLLQSVDSLETNVALSGLLEGRRGPEAVEDILSGAMARERQRYDARLSVLATVGSNAPFIGLFGTVLGIIRAFQDLALDMSDASTAVMAGISEALVATAVGLVVAIPAVMAFNWLRTRVSRRVADTEHLTSTLLAYLKGGPMGEEV